MFLQKSKREILMGCRMPHAVHAYRPSQEGQRHRRGSRSLAGFAGFVATYTIVLASTEIKLNSETIWHCTIGCIWVS